MENAPHLIVLRGNAASGKSTLAAALQRALGPGTANIGQDVAKHYRDMLREILTQHQGPTHVFYLDVPLEETLRRHAARPLGAEVSADKLREWYVQSDSLGLPGEVVLDGTADLEVTLKVILDRVGDVPTKEETARGRYL